MSDEFIRELISRIERLEKKVSDIQAAGVTTGLSWNKIPLAQDVRGQFFTSSTTVQDFTGTTIPSGWAWAGSPFSTPIQVDFNSSRIIVFPGTGIRSFLVSNLSVSSGYTIGYIGAISENQGSCCGLRLDDGTDNNYVECLIIVESGVNRSLAVRWRTGGGAVNTSYLAQNVIVEANSIGAWTNGTLWSSWSMSSGFWQLPTGRYYGSAMSGTMAWTPTRKGIVFYTVASWNRFAVDWFG
jgi:hypothetical protein